ncbi:MAG: hypothetical protein WBO17_11845 [Sphingorhabdus sp.]
MDILRGSIAFIAAAVAVFGLTSLASASRPDGKGWRHLTPSPLHWTALSLGSCLTLFMAYIALFVGSSRLDAQTQLSILKGLILAFGFLSIATAASIFALRHRSVRWRGANIAFNAKSGRELRHMSEIVRVNGNFVGQIVLTFADATILRIDPHAKNAGELLERINDNRAS